MTSFRQLAAVALFLGSAAGAAAAPQEIKGAAILEHPATQVALKNMSLMGVFWGGYVHEHPGYVAECQAALDQLFLDGKIHPRVARTYALSELPQALRDMANRKVIGKTVVVP